MVTLKQLQKENARLRKMQTALNEAKKIQEERQKLLRQNKSLSRNIKYGKVIGFGKAIGKSSVIVGKGLGKVGKSAFCGLKKYADYLERQEMKQRQFNRKLKRGKK